LGSAHLPGFVQEEAAIDDYVSFGRKFNIKHNEKQKGENI
jgi:hypothetical protein